MSDDLAEQLARSLAELGRERRDERFDNFDARTLSRVTLLPRWTKDLAVELDLVHRGTFADLIAELDRAGLIERGIDTADAGPPQEMYWIRDRYRREIGVHLQDRLGDDLVDEYERLCALVESRKHDDRRLSRWLEVREYRADPSGRLLMERVDSLLAEDELARAAETVATARLVSDTLGGTLEGAVKRAQWRLDRAYSAADDLDHLRGYFRRSDVEGAIRRLITAAGDENPPWALHLLGDAGVGKTMTLRYLASGQFAKDHGLPPLAVARVDFDHLDPRYPEQRPVELLVALTDQLLGFASSRAAEQYHRWVHDTAGSLHEELAKPEPDESRAAGLVAEVVERFARLAEEVSGQVVLVLDTCEELAKLYTPMLSAPSIDRTFKLLEQLHDRAPDVRVVFAGRRLLVPPDSELYGGPRLLPRDYLEVVPVSEFTAEEAHRFLDSREIPGQLRAALLQRSIVGGTDRYNPFELESYSSWVRSDPEVEASDLLNAPGDPYVEHRILGRIDDPRLLTAIPVAVALIRFDRTLITAALRRLRVDVDAAFHQLASQEWVTVTGLRHDGRPRVIEVKEHLRDRLRKALAHSESGPPLDERCLGRDAAAVIRANPLSVVAAETVEAAMRLLPVDEAAVLWTEVDRRVPEQDDWGWALQLAPRIAAIENARPSPGPCVLAPVLATQAAARLHTGQRQGLSGLWTEVHRTASRHPDPEQRRYLTLRAELGQVAAGHKITFYDLESLIARALERTDLFDALLSAAESLSAKPARMRLVGQVLSAVGRSSDEALAANARLLLESLRLRYMVETGFSLSYSGLALSTEHASRSAKHHDWIAPTGMVDRARLVLVLKALYGDSDPLPETTWRAWREEARLRRAKSIDADRLFAATIDYELCHRVVPVDALPGDLQHQTWEAVDWLHHGLARPLVVAVADALDAAGRPGEAVELLRRYQQEAAESGDDARVVEACELAVLRLCRRHRRTDWAPVVRLANEGTARVRAEAWLVLRLVEGLEPSRSLLSDYGYWRCAPASAPPLEKWRAADHVDVWEAQTLATDVLTHQLLPDAPRARGTSALLAGEIRGLTAPERGKTLILLACQEFRTAGDLGMAALARSLADRHAPRTSLDLSVRDHESRPPTTTPGVTVNTISRELWLARVDDWLSASSAAGAGAALVTATAGSLAITASFFSPLLGAVVTAIGAVAVGGALSARGRATNDFPPIDIVRIGGKASPWHGVEPAEGCLLSEMDGIEPSTTAARHAYNRWPRRDLVTLDPETAPAKVKQSRLITRARYVRRRGDRAVLGLDIARHLQHLAWEQWLGQAGGSRLADPLVFRVHRGVTREPRTGAPVFRGPPHLRPRNAAENSPDSRLVHLVGTPVSTSAGTLFRIGGREHLVDVERTNAGMLVLQAEPVDKGPSPIDSTRADFLRCALAAVNHSVETVLIVPHLSDSLSKSTTERIWRTTKADVLSTADVLSMFRDVQMLIRSHEEQRPGTTAALDLVLFHRRITPLETE